MSSKKINYIYSESCKDNVEKNAQSHEATLTQ